MAQIRRHLRGDITGAKICLLALTFGLLFQTASATEKQTLTLVENERSWPITEISVNGVPTSALLDTGATIALINRAYVPQDPETVAPTAEAQVLGIGGQRLYPVTELASLSAGTQAWRDLRVIVNETDEFPVHLNILPASIFAASVIDFDFQNARVDLYDGRPKRVRGASRNVIRYDEANGLIYIPVRINGVRGKALIDTGADVSFTNIEYARAARAILRAEDIQNMQGSDLEENNVRVYTFRNLTFGDHRISRFRVPALQTDLFRDLGFEDAPMMVIGMDMLKHFRLQIDRDRQRVTFLH